MYDKIYEKMKGIFEFVELAKDEPDKASFMDNILNFISRNLNAHQSMCAFQSEDFRTPEFLMRNIPGEFAPLYKKYYYRLDPFQFLSTPSKKSRIVLGPGHEKGVVRLEELVNYRTFVETEYYCDFLQPQKQYYKVMSYLKSQNRPLGVIGIFRPKQSKNFSDEEIELLKLVSPLISTSMENIALRNKTKLKSELFEIIEMESSKGLLLFNQSMKLLFMNGKAKEICSDLNEIVFKSENVSVHIPEIISLDCQAMLEKFKSYPRTISILPKQRIVRSKSRKYELLYKFLEKDFGSELKKIIMVTIEQTNNLFDQNEKRIRQCFSFTNREVEIVRHIMRGLRNIDIAEKLCISELTVKKHIQNIFEKTGVNSRSAAIHKILVILKIS